MWRLVLIAVIAWIIGVFGWSQIIGSLQNLDRRKSLFFTLIVWIVILGAVAYIAIVKFNGQAPLIIGYAISFIQVKAQDRIE